MRSLWKGSISFGLVNIPVRLYAATENRDIRFNTLHRRCGSPIRYKKFCPHCNQDVEQADLIKGYPIESGHYITLEEDELKSLPIETARRVDILDFISLSEIDPVYYERSYYLEPAEGAEKPYFLLREAMLQSQRVAIAKVALRQKESLACVRVYDQILLMETMLYPDEIRSPQRLERIHHVPELDAKELDMAIRLIDNLTEPFNPAKYTDRYREALAALIQSKIEGNEQVPVPAAEPTEGVEDLLAALQASINATAAERPREPVIP